MRLRWHDLGTPRADDADDAAVELGGYLASPLPIAQASHCLLVAEPACCAGCLPRHPLAAVEVFAAAPLPLSGAPVRLSGRWRRQTGADGAPRYQLHDARLAEPAGWSAVGRRFVLRGAPLMCLAAAAVPTEAAFAQQNQAAQARQAIGGIATVDMHSHAGNIIRANLGTENLYPVAGPMAQGGMAAVCFAIVSDTPTHHIVNGRIRPYRSPAPGELYDWAQRGFQRLHALIAQQKLAVITDAASLRAARGGTPSAIVAAEGGDFLEGRPDRVDEAYQRWQLRHLQLTHFRVNELGDIQTEEPDRGLTDIGAEVIRRCNRLGVVVDTAHGTFELVKRAASVTTRPLILSHTSLTTKPRPFTRLITPDHARLIAGTGGVVGIWPPGASFPDLTAMAHGMRRMVEVVGVDHVGLGSDMMGLVGSSVFDNYALLPDLAAAMLSVGFSPAEVGKVLGGNYVRVFAATMA